MLDSYAQHLVRPLVKVAVRGLASLGIAPNQVTLGSAAMGVAAAVAFYAGLHWTAVLLIIAAGVGDLLDGALARETGRATPLGGLLDLWLDRLVEVSVLVAYALVYPDVRLAIVVLACTIILSLTVFLTMGALLGNDGHKVIPYQPGIAERAETIIFFALFFAFPAQRHVWIYLFAALIALTVLQRLYLAWRTLK